MDRFKQIETFVKVADAGSLAAAALEEARPYAADLGGEAALGEIERILAEGNGAEAQRRAFERGGIPAVLDHLAGATGADHRVARGAHALRLGGGAPRHRP